MGKFLPPFPPPTLIKSNSKRTQKNGTNHGLTPAPCLPNPILMHRSRPPPSARNSILSAKKSTILAMSQRDPHQGQCHDVARMLGWEFQFLVLISGTPIRGGIPILFTILKIPVCFFWNSDFWRARKLEFRFVIFGIPAISCTGTQYIFLSLICIDSKACTMI